MGIGSFISGLTGFRMIGAFLTPPGAHLKSRLLNDKNTTLLHNRTLIQPGTRNVSRTTGFCLIKIVCRSASHWEMKYLKSKGLNPANLWSCNNEGFPLHFDLFVIKYQMTASVCQSKDWMSTFIFVWVVTGQLGQIQNTDPESQQGKSPGII